MQALGRPASRSTPGCDGAAPPGVGAVAAPSECAPGCHLTRPCCALGIEQTALIGLFRRRLRPRWRRWRPATLPTGRPNGHRPPEGDILDQAIISSIECARAGYHERRGAVAIAARRSPFACCLGVGFGHQPAKKWNQFGAVTLSVLQRLIAADEQAAGAERIVGEQRFGDRIRGSDQGG
jgi:hypothetical protein